MHDDRCSNCGKFVEKDADGFYDREWPYDDRAHVVVYCDEACCNAKRAKDAEARERALAETAPRHMHLL